jgi:hypothetical protein
MKPCTFIHRYRLVSGTCCLHENEGRNQITRRHSRNRQQYELIVPLLYSIYWLLCTSPLFYILAPTCFGSSLPSAGSFLDPSELFERGIEWVVYHIMCGYVICVHRHISMPKVGFETMIAAGDRP